MKKPIDKLISSVAVGELLCQIWRKYHLPDVKLGPVLAEVQKMPEADYIQRDKTIPAEQDLINRQQAIDRIRMWLEYDGYSEGERNVMGCTIQMLEQLPSAETDLSEYSDKLWRSAYERGKAEAQRTGKWITIPNGLLYYKSFECSECGMQIVKGNPDNYCPNCGRRNEVQDADNED